MNTMRYGLKMAAGGMLGLSLMSAPACKNKPDEPETTSSTSSSGTSTGGTSTGGTSTGSTTGTQGGQTSAGSTQTETSGSTGGGICGGPEHVEFQQALCPEPYPSCTPLPEEMEGTKYCADNGVGPVGAGECSCTPRLTFCGVDGSDEMLTLCCCPLEDLGFDP